MVDRIIGNNRKRKVKRLSGSALTNSSYYPSAFINKPCDQLFGPQPLDCSINSVKNSLESSNNSIHDTSDYGDRECSFSNSINTSACNSKNTTAEILIKHAICLTKENATTITTTTTSTRIEAENISSEKFTYIPAPKWNKIQNSLLEELFRKSRYPKPTELKQFAQRLNVMDSDIEVIIECY